MGARTIPMKSNQFDQPNAVMAEGAVIINIEFFSLLLGRRRAPANVLHMWNATNENRRSANVLKEHIFEIHAESSSI